MQQFRRQKLQLRILWMYGKVCCASPHRYRYRISTRHCQYHSAGRHHSHPPLADRRPIRNAMGFSSGSHQLNIYPQPALFPQSKPFSNVIGSKPSPSSDEFSTSSSILVRFNSRFFTYSMPTPVSSGYHLRKLSARCVFCHLIKYVDTSPCLGGILDRDSIQVDGVLKY